MINSKDFLGDGSFVAQTTKKHEGVLKPTSLTIERTLGLSPGKTHSYQIVDNPLRLDSRDWDRVVAVIALGKSWQFKGWRWDQPVDLFTQCIGIHLKFADEPLAPAVGQWNVNVVNVQKSQRHLDRTVAGHFWALVDAFVRVKHPKLAAPGT